MHAQLRKDLKVVKAFEDHTEPTQRQFEKLKVLGKELPLGHCVVHVDYIEKPKIPLGPEEPGSWWQEVMCFGRARSAARGRLHS